MFQFAYIQIIFNYTINSNILKTVSEIRDLGVIYTNNFSFNAHINTIISKAFKTLGFIKRSTANFTNTTITLYKQLLLPILDYCSPIWSPSSKKQIFQLERVQRKFVKHLRYKCSVSYDHDDYFSYLKDIPLKPLFLRRIKATFSLTLNISSEQTKCTYLRSLINHYLPPRILRSTRLYMIPHFRTNLLNNHPIYSI